MYSNIKDFQILELLVEGPNSMVYRARKKVDDSNVIIKMLKPESSGSVELLMLNHEFELLRAIDSTHIIKAFELVPIQNSQILILEDFPSRNLGALIEEDNFDLLKALDLAIEISEGVGDIHHQNIIHKDIKPQNILVGLESKKLKIIDFGTASLLSREMSEKLAPEHLQGSIHYMSPEQTGRMNREIDYRSDIYSVGVTLYQLFTKKLPFESDSALEVIHAHIAQKPIPPHERNPEVPKVISDIILKCLAKQAENRYHSSFGLKKDLEKCRKLYLETNEISEFPLGEHDVYDHWHIPNQLYGRQKEINFINQKFSEVISGAFLLLTVTGYEGVGKTRLIEDVQENVAAKNGFFVKATFDQLKRNQLYSGWVQVFQNLINQILAESDEDLAFWRTRIQEAIGENGQIIADIIPELKLIIGETKPVAKLTPIENENRFNYTLSIFLKSLLVPERPLVLFFDNVQWADESSLKLLDQFFSDQHIQHLMIILSYRENETDSFHPLQIALKEITSKASVKHYSLNLKPLSQEAVTEMIGDLFFGPPKQIEQLSALIFRKTQGNPFFTLQFLKYLYDKELLFFDKKHSCWMSNLDKIAQEKVAENVADLMIESFKKIPPEIVNILKICSILENKFSKEIITEISQASPEAIDQIIKRALNEDLIAQERRENFTDPITYRFVHERIQNAAYSLLTDKERQELHNKVGHYLLKHLTEDQINSRCIDVVNHLNYGYDSQMPEAEKFSLAELNYKAGIKAKDSAAYLPAIQYFSKAVSLLGPDAWEKHYDLAMELHSNLALCHQIIGAAKQAQAEGDLCIRMAKTNFEKAEMYFLSITLDSQLQNYDRVFETAAKAFKLFEYPFNFQPSRLSLLKDLLLLKLRFKVHKMAEVEEMPRSTDERSLFISKIISAIQYPAFVTAKKNLFLKNTLQLVNYTLKHGVMQQSSVGFSTYAMILSSIMLHDYKTSIKLGEAAMKMASMYPKVVESAGTLYMNYAFIHRWQNPLRDSPPGLRLAYRTALESGLLNIAAATAVYIPMVALATGDKLKNVLDSINENIKEISKFKADAEQMSLAVHREFCRALLGETVNNTDPRPPELTDELLSPENTNKNLLYALRYDVWHVVLLFLFGKFDEAHGVAKRVLAKSNNYPNWIEWHIFYFFHSLTLAALIQDPKIQKEEYATLMKHHRLLQKWAEASPINYAHHEVIVRAEIKRVNKDYNQLADIYEEGINLAKKNNTTQDIAIAYELYAKYHLSKDANELASFFLQKALQYYTQWGAISKCLYFRNLYAEYLSIQTHALSSMPMDGRSFDETSVTKGFYTSINSTRTTQYLANTPNQEFDVQALIESSQALSKELFLDKLLESLMHIVIVNAGADKAFLLLEEKGKLLVYSEIKTDQKYAPILTPKKVEDRSDDLCAAIVKFVARTKKEVLLNDASEEGNFRYDPYVLSKNPKSILCLPLIQKGVLNGVLYLENTASKGAFTPNRTRLLSLLSSQMAISLENVQFYANLEVKVQERTRDLQYRNEELKEALRIIKNVQAQMIQQEKLASLGLLTSGIAHELKNPLNFVINFSKVAHENLAELTTELNRLGLSDDNIKEISSILADSLEKVDAHSKRADSIIKGMLAHAHRSGNPELVDINELLNQSLNLTFHTYRKKDARFNLTINHHYDTEMKPISVYVGDILRVFINVIENACYAMLDKFNKHPEYKPVLDVTTHFEKDRVHIHLRDNGPGIPQSVIDKIFQPFFTTKPTGTGTGLGLSIVYDVVTKQHKGKIEVSSVPDQFTEFHIVLPAIDIEGI